MKILITGANGTIGSDLVDYFSKNHKIYAFYRSNNNIVESLRSKNINWIKQDLKNKIKLNIKPDIIIHSVATHPFAKKNSYEDYINSNIIALKNIIDLANRRKVKNFIYLSSFIIYGDIKQNILEENNLFLNPTLLGATKNLSEKIIEQQKFKYIILRLPGVLTYLNRDPRRPWINKIINDFKKNNKINVYNANKPFNNFIDTMEIARFIEHVIKLNLFYNCVINLSASHPIQLKKLLLFLKKKLNSKSKIVYNRKKTENYYISSKNLKKKFNFNPLTTLNLLTKIIDTK